MNNPYSIGLVTIAIISILLGGTWAWAENYYGVIPFLFGAYILSGFKTLKDSPRTVGIISFFGKRTNYKVEGLTLLMPNFLGLKIVDVIEFEIVQKDITFDIVRADCKKGYVYGNVSLSIIPDDDSAYSLARFDDIGRTEGIKPQSNDIVIMAIQTIAKEKEDREMEQGSDYINRDVLRLIEGKNIEGKNDDNPFDDIHDLGFKIKKIQIKLFRPDEIIRAERDSLVAIEIERRINQRIDYLRKHTTSLIITTELISKIRAELLQEMREASGNIREVRGGGKNLNLVS